MIPGLVKNYPTLWSTQKKLLTCWFETLIPFKVLYLGLLTLHSALLHLLETLPVDHIGNAVKFNRGVLHNVVTQIESLLMVSSAWRIAKNHKES